MAKEFEEGDKVTLLGLPSYMTNMKFIGTEFKIVEIDDECGVYELPYFISNGTINYWVNSWMIKKV